MKIVFTGEIFYWRGPAPFLFLAIPPELSAEIKVISTLVTYGWGVIPAQCQIGHTRWKTSLFPKNGRYLVPLKQAVQKAENLAVGQSISIQVEVGPA